MLISLLLLLPKLRLWYYLILPSYCSYLLIPLIYFPFKNLKFIKFTLTFPACIFTIHNITTSVAHFSCIFLIKTKFRFTRVFWLLRNIKQPPLTPKLSTANAGVDLTLPTMTLHGANTCFAILAYWCPYEIRLNLCNKSKTNMLQF